MEVIGIRNVHYVSKKTGREVFGTELHVTEKRQDTIGLATDKIFCGGKVEVNHVSIGNEIRVLYNRFGQVDFVEVI